MSTHLDSHRLGLIFQSRPDIIEGINTAAGEHGIPCSALKFATNMAAMAPDSPGRIALFNEIASHVYDRLHNNGEPALKRRKVDTAADADGTQQASGNAADEPVLLHVKEISVSVPQRKKFEICLTQNFIYARAPGTTAPIPAITYAWKDIGACCLSASVTARQLNRDQTPRDQLTFFRLPLLLAGT
jgi:hypothetical protein